MRIRKIMIVSLLLLSVLMIGAVSASDNITDETVSLEQDTTTIEEASASDDEISQQDVELIGQASEDKLSSARTYDIYDFNALHSALTSDEYDQVTINIKSNILLTNNTDVSSSITSLIINGNGKTVNGDGKYQFLTAEYSTLTLKNLKFVNCRGQYGGAIDCEGDYTSITNCVFTNCRAYHPGFGSIIWINGVVLRMYGGAIYNSGSHATISNNVFENNEVSGTTNYKEIYMRGGAIFNSGDDVTISNNVFRNNYADVKGVTCLGGAIYTNGDNSRMTNNVFEHNGADYGGAIYNYGDNTIISSNRFNYNYADVKGNAIYNVGDSVTMEANSFKLNKDYGSQSSVIYTSESDTELSNNQMISTSSYSYGTVYNVGNSVKIRNNVFDDRHSTVLNVPTSVESGKNLVITLKDDQGNVLSGMKVTVTLKKSKTYTTDKNGQIKVSTKGLKTGKQNMKVSFAGTSNYLKSSFNGKLTVKKPAAKIIAKSKTFKKNAKKKYQITVKNNAGKPMASAKVTLKVAKKTYKAKTNAKGKATFNIKLSKKGKYSATIKTAANKYCSSTSKKVTITIK